MASAAKWRMAAGCLLVRISHIHHLRVKSNIAACSIISLLQVTHNIAWLMALIRLVHAVHHVSGNALKPEKMVQGTGRPLQEAL